jgi:hypothetical protein
MNRLFARLAAASILVSAANLVHASSPGLGSITPRGGQRGTEMAMLFSGARLSDAKEILFYTPGFSVTKLEVVNDNQVKATVKIAADCALGEHAMRIRTASGISELRTFWVGALPTVDEKEPNSDFAAPQPIALNVTVNGVVDNEDVDYYVVECKKGQRLSVEIEGMRLANTVFDPYVAILDAKRFELAAADDSALVRQDAVAAVLIAADGKYVVQVRESAYGGNGACSYRLHVGTFPRPTALVPAGGKVGEEVEVQFLGDVTGPFTQKFKLPGTIDARFGLVPQDAGGIAPSAHVFRLAEFGNVLEKEPNNSHEQGTPAELPLAMNGVIGAPGDVDFFRFKAKKGETFDVHCYARRIRSPLDPVMTVYHFAGGGIVGNDDAIGPDSYFRFTAPEDKEYSISVGDHLRKGGVSYAYRIEFTPVRPVLDMSIPKVANYSQERQTIVVPRGNRYATLVAASRANFGGELAIEADGLPAGVKLNSDNMPANLTVIPVLFEAAPDAPVAGSLANLLGRHIDPNAKIRGGFTQTAELIIGAPGQSVYWATTVNRLAVAVADEVPFKLQIVEPKVPLVQNGSMNLKVVAERKDGFKAAIALYMLFNPPGVGSASSVTIPEGQNEALYPLNANGGAEVRNWKIAVIGQAPVGNGPMWVSSQLATLEIAPPYITIAQERGAVEQGQQTDVFCKVQHNKPFEGKAKVQLLGLPHKVTAAEVEITKDTKEFAFKVAADKESPAGQHKTLFCRVEIAQNGESVVASTGGTELRIDKPLPPKVNEPPKPPPPKPVAQAPAAPAPPPPEKRLTRLEKLRLEQAERANASKGAAPAGK